MKFNVKAPDGSTVVLKDFSVNKSYTVSFFMDKIYYNFGGRVVFNNACILFADEKGMRKIKIPFNKFCSDNGSICVDRNRTAVCSGGYVFRFIFKSGHKSDKQGIG